ncbi:MAG: DUF4147 domain-containing protein [Arenicellales bacterium]
MQSSIKSVDSSLLQADQIWHAAVKSVNGETATQKALADEKEDAWRYVLAVGKGASAMLKGAIDSIASDAHALLVTKYHHVIQALADDARVKIIESGHPMPDRNSLRAGRKVREFVSAIPSDASLLILVSGGASALVEDPHAGIDLATLQNLSERLLADGYSIDQINLVRIAISRIKGGKLLQQFHGRLVRVYALSDIPGDDADLIGSGIAAIKAPVVASFDIPSGIKEVMERARASNDLQDVSTLDFEYCASLVGSNTMARLAGAEKAELFGLPVIESNEILNGDILDLAPKLAARIKAGKPGVYIWGGESTVCLPTNPGTGGRNQSLAVALGIEVSDQPGVAGVVAGTDGTDGPTDAAGGFFHSGMNLSGGRDALLRADAGTWLKNSDKLFITGPTGTNVMDLAVVIKQE